MHSYTHCTVHTHMCMQDVSRVTNLDSILDKTNETAAAKFNANIAQWNVSAVTTAQNVFRGTSLLPCTKRMIFSSWSEQWSSAGKSAPEGWSDYSAWPALIDTFTDENLKDAVGIWLAHQAASDSTIVDFRLSVNYCNISEWCVCIHVHGCACCTCSRAQECEPSDHR